jgi:hypothetical protein
MATRFLLNNYIDTSNLNSIPSAYPNLPIENVKYLSKSLVCRVFVAQNNSVEISGVLADIKDINCIVFAGHNFEANTEVEITYYSDRPQTSIITTLNPLIYLVPSAFAVTDNKMSCFPIWLDYMVNGVQSFKIKITNVSTTSDYLQIYRLFMGEYIESTIGAFINNNWYYKDTSNQYRTEAGTLKTDYIKPHKVIEFDLGIINESERSKLSRNIARVGMQKEFYISIFKNSCQNSKELDYSGVVKLTKIPSYTEFANRFYNSKLIVEEV